MPEPKVKKAPAKPVQKVVLFDDTKKYGTVAQQTEMGEFMQGLTPEQLLVIQALIQRMSTGACINGDGTIDAATGLRTTGGYRKSVHYIKAYFANRPLPVKVNL